MTQSESRKQQVINDSQRPEITKDDSGVTYSKHQTKKEIYQSGTLYPEKMSFKNGEIKTLPDK